MARRPRCEQSCVEEDFVDSSQICPLCSSGDSRSFFHDNRRRYWQCQHCQLVFVPGCYHLAAAAERAEYQLHDNRLDDAGYRHFLQRAATPLLQQLTASAHGVDIGCGPAPLLAQLLSEAGHRCDYYDPLFFPETPPHGYYDFITLTEVVEHMANPQRDLLPLGQQLRAGGWLLIMTKRVLNAERFARWHYKNDPTHISFFSESTLHWLAQHWRVPWRSAADDVALFGPF